MLTITACGHDSHHPKPCNIKHNCNLRDYLVLLVKSESWHYINDQKVLVKPNMIIIYPPNSFIHYGCDNCGYNDDWIRIRIEQQEDNPFTGLDIPFSTPLYPHDFYRLSQYVLLLSDAFINPQKNTPKIVESLLTAFLYDLEADVAANSAKPVDKYYSAFSQLRTSIYNNPASATSIPELAKSMLLSVSYFQHMYKNYFGCSCQQDIITARLKIACFYLSTTDMTVSDIAYFCGYENDIHFMRQFKKNIGMTPSEYRINKVKAT